MTNQLFPKQNFFVFHLNPFVPKMQSGDAHVLAKRILAPRIGLLMLAKRTFGATQAENGQTVYHSRDATLSKRIAASQTLDR
jgi:hypothetical protein